MGEIVPLSSFTVIGPRRPFTPVERLQAVHLLIAAAEPHLSLPNDGTAGLKLLARTACVQIAHELGAAQAAVFAEQIAHDLRDAAKLGWCGNADKLSAFPDDEPPRPAA